MIELIKFRNDILTAIVFPTLLLVASMVMPKDNDHVIEQLVPKVVGPETVIIGEPYVAEVFLTAGAGQGQRLVGNGILQVEGDSRFVVPTAGLLADDETEKVIELEGTAFFPLWNKGETSLPVAVKPHIIRPEIIATSETTTTLYREVFSQVRFDVPGLENRTLRLVSGGRRVEGRTLALSPPGEETTVVVYLIDDATGEDVFLGRKSFAVIPPPRPELRVLNAGREVRSGDNLPRGRALLTFEVVPDASFLMRFPKDAQYKIGHATVSLCQGLTVCREVGTFDLNDGRTLALTPRLREARPGDRVLVQLHDVVRVNHAGAEIPVPLGAGSLTFGYTLID